MVTSDLFSELDEDAQLLNKIGYIRDNIYTAQMCSQQDRDVVSYLADTIMKGIVFNTVGILTFSDYEIPLPPPDIGKLLKHLFFCLVSHWLKKEYKGKSITMTNAHVTIYVTDVIFHDKAKNLDHHIQHQKIFWIDTQV